MLTDAAIVYPIATPNKFKYWIHPHASTFFPPAAQMKVNYNDKNNENHLSLSLWPWWKLLYSPKLALTASM